jgi:hypothetical protein
MVRRGDQESSRLPSDLIRLGNHRIMGPYRIGTYVYGNICLRQRAFMGNQPFMKPSGEVSKGALSVEAASERPTSSSAIDVKRHRRDPPASRSDAPPAASACSRLKVGGCPLTPTSPIPYRHLPSDPLPDHRGDATRRGVFPCCLLCTDSVQRRRWRPRRPARGPSAPTVRRLLSARRPRHLGYATAEIATNAGATASAST